MSRTTTVDDALYEGMYRELRRRAHMFLHAERPGHTLQPTEIVHEVWLRMRSVEPCILDKRDEYLSLAAHMMRNLLVDYARRRNSERRGGALQRVDLDSKIFSEDSVVSILEIEAILQQIESADPRSARVLELRFFAGLSELETAQALGVSPRTVRRDWKFIKAWVSGHWKVSPADPSEAFELISPANPGPTSPENSTHATS